MHHTTNPMLPKLPQSHARGRQQGFSIIELMVVLAVAGMLIVGALVAGTTVMNGVKANRYVNEISTIATQTRAWKGVKTNYSDITIDKLVKMGRLPNATNAEGGAYTLKVGNPTSTFIITSDGMTNKICEDVIEQIKGQAIGNAKVDADDTAGIVASDASEVPVCKETKLTATFK